MKKYFLLLFLILSPALCFSQTREIRQLVDRTPVTTDALEIETAANQSGFVLLSEIFTLYDSNTSTLTNKTINTASNTITIVEADISDLAHTVDTVRSEEEIEDFVGGMLLGTETQITVTYDDIGGFIDFVVDSLGGDLSGPLSAAVVADNSHNHVEANISDLVHTTDTVRSQEEIEDFVGAMFSLNTETQITVTYQDIDGTIDLVVDALGGDLSGTLGAAVVADNSHNHVEANITDLAHTVEVNNLESAVPSTILDNETFVGTGAGTGSFIALQNCADGTESLDFNGTAFVCNTITGGSASNSFETWSVPAGTNPVADAPTDTVTFTAGTGLTITGTAASDTIDFAVTANSLGDGQITDNALTSLSLAAASVEWGSEIADDLGCTGTQSVRRNAGDTAWECFTPSAGGEANTASNLGGGLANFDTKSGVDLRFNSFAAADFDLATNVISIDDATWLNEAELDSKAELQTQVGVTDFAEANGDVFTGIHDFGGATSLEVPNGAAPAITVLGRVAVDTTDGDLIWRDSTGERALPSINRLTFSLESPADTQNILGPKFVRAITITDIHCIVDPADTSESVVIDFQERDGTGDTPTSVDTTITCDNDGAEDDGTFTNPSIDAGDWTSLDIGTVTGTVSNLSVTVYFRVNRT